MPVVGSVFEKPLDDDVYGLQNALAIIVNGDTAPSALSQGKYIYLINHSTIRSGLYKIISAIASGDTIVSTDIETVPDGIINDLIEADGAKVDKIDIVNNLTTNDSTKVLSAAQGYALNSNIANKLKKLNFSGVDFNANLIKNLPVDGDAYAGVFLTNSNTRYVYIGNRFSETNGTLLCFNYADSKLYKCVLNNDTFNYYTIG